MKSLFGSHISENEKNDAKSKVDQDLRAVSCKKFLNTVVLSVPFHFQSHTFTEAHPDIADLQSKLFKVIGPSFSDSKLIEGHNSKREQLSLVH